MSMKTRKERLISLILCVVLFVSMIPAAVHADGARFGRVNYNQVRFRKTDSSAEGQEWWTMLNAGWVVEILGESANNFGRWYKVTCVIPEDPTHAYVGYMMRQYITEMSAAEIAAWLSNPVQPGMEGSGGIAVPTASPVPVSDMSGAVNTANVFFRKTPSFNAESWALLPLGHPLDLVEKEPVKNGGAEWYHVVGAIPSDPTGLYEGYIYKPYFTPGQVPPATVPTALPTQTPAPAVQPGAANAGVVNTDKVFFRKNPIFSAGYHAILPIGFSLFLLDPDPVSYNGVKWYHVSGPIPSDMENLYEGYIYEPFLTLTTMATETPAPLPTGMEPTATPKATEAPASRTGYVNTDKVFFRRSASFNAAYWAILPVGFTLTLVEEAPVKAGGVEWYHVTGGTPNDMSGSYEGYIYSPFFTLIKPEITATPEPEPTEAPNIVYATVVVSGANLKVAPSADSVTVTALIAGQILEVIGSPDAEMVHVRVGTFDGYVSAASIRFLAEYTPSPTFTPSPTVTETPQPVLTAVPTSTPTAQPVVSPVPTETATPENATNYYSVLGYVRIIKPDVNLRRSPNGASMTLDGPSRLQLYTILPFYRMPIKSGDYYWIYVNHNGTYGYIRSDCYEILTSTPTVNPNQTPGPTAKPDSEITGYIILSKEGVNLRATPNGATLTPKSEDLLHIYTVLPYYGEAVTVSGYDWLYVYSNGKFGYIRSDCYSYYTPVDPTPVPSKEHPAGYIRLTEPNVNFRREPDGTVITQLRIGTVLPYIRTVQDKVYQQWFYVYSEDLDTYGYIKGTVAQVTSAPTLNPALTQTPPPQTDVTPSPSPTPAPAVKNYVYTTYPLVYIRKDAGMNNLVVTQVTNINTVLILTGAAKKDAGGTLWYPVVYNGFSGYISSQYTSQMNDWQKEVYEATGVLPTASPIPSTTPAPTGTPSPTATPDLSPQASSSYLMITTNLVNVRTAPSMVSAVVDGYLQVNQGDVFAYTAVERDKQGYQYTWYRIVYQDTVAGYVRSDFARVMSNEEYALYLSQFEPALPASTSQPLAYKRLALDSAGEEVIKVQTALYELGYLFESEVTGTFDTLTQNAVIEYQYEHGLTVTGIVDEETWNALFPVTDSIPTEGANNPGSSVSVTLNPVEKSDWYTGDIQSVFAPGVVASVTDVYTGISYRVKRWAGGLHADVEPLTAADTAAICQIYGTGSAQEIVDNQDQLEAWRRRPLWVTIGNRTYAASAYGVPHNDDAQTILDNNYPGQFCIHFINSKVHRTEVVDTANPNNDNFGHQEAIEYAYTHSISGTK